MEPKVELGISSGNAVYDDRCAQSCADKHGVSVADYDQVIRLPDRRYEDPELPEFVGRRTRLVL
jgi:hypothetical protein